MLNRLIAWALANRVIVLAASVILLVLGAWTAWPPP